MLRLSYPESLVNQMKSLLTYMLMKSTGTNSGLNEPEDFAQYGLLTSPLAKSSTLGWKYGAL